MAEKQYAAAAGIVQKFGDKDVVTEREVSNQTVRDFTIKTVPKQQLVRITLFPEFDALEEIERGAFVSADGGFNVNKGDNGVTYYNLTARSLTYTPPVPRAEREVVNSRTDEGDASADTDGAPF